MTRIRKLQALTAIWALALIGGCANLAATSSLVVVSAMDAGEVAATAGKAAHILRLEALTGEATAIGDAAAAKRAELGCGAPGTAPESYPAGCDASAWNAYRLDAGVELAEVKEKIAAETERFDTFESLMVSHASAVTVAGRTILALDTGDGSRPSVVEVIALLVESYRAVAEAVRAWGVEPPAIPGL